MPIGYLLSVALVAIGTLFTLWPVPWSRPLGRVSYFVGVTVNELPFATFFWMLLSRRRWRSPKVTSTRRAVGRP